MSSNEVLHDNSPPTTTASPDEVKPPSCYNCGIERRELDLGFEKLKDGHNYCNKCTVELANKGLGVKDE